MNKVVKSLSQLDIGQGGIICNFLSRDKKSEPIFLRLQELGLVIGTPVQVARRAPLGDPIELKVRGSRLSIRNSEAALIQVTL